MQPEDERRRSVLVVDTAGQLVSIEGDEHYVESVPGYMDLGLPWWVAVSESIGDYGQDWLVPLDDTGAIARDQDCNLAWPDIAPFDDPVAARRKVFPARNIQPKRRGRPAPRIR